MWVATADLPQSAGHPFYERRAACFDPKTGHLLPMDEWPLEARMSLEHYGVVVENVTAAGVLSASGSGRDCQLHELLGLAPARLPHQRHVVLGAPPGEHPR